MFSVTSTGTCSLPLCTAIVRPTNSGMTTERRDQVLIGFLSLLARAVSTFLIRWSSTNGPFFSERGMARLSISCDAARSCYPCACCDASCNPSPAYPTDSAGCCRPCCDLHHHRADGRPGLERLLVALGAGRRALLVL